MTTPQFEDVVSEVDLVFDTVGGDRLQRSPTVIRQGGRLISVASEPPHESAKAQGITSLYFVVSPNREQLIQITKLVDDGVLQLIVDKVFPLSKAREAFECSLLHRGAGKIALRVASE